MLSGNLADFALLDVMQLLLSSGRTGRLHLDHPRGGDVWLENGEVIHATSLGRRGEDALSLIASLGEGRFNFEQDALSPEKTISLRREAVLTRMLTESDAWTPIVRAFPDWVTPVRFTPGWSEQTRVTRRQYQVLSGVGQGGLCALLSRTDLPAREVMELLLPFWQAGKIEYAA